MLAQAKSKPVLSIMTVSRTASNVSRLLSSIVAQDLRVPFEVLCSWNGTREAARTINIAQKVEFKIFEQRPYHFAKNNNSLAREAHGEFLLFINDDIVLDRFAIDRALKAITVPWVGIVGINLRYEDGILQHAGILFTDDGRPYHRLKHKVRWNDPAVTVDMAVPCVTGAFILMRRQEFLALQFDEAFDVCGEDIALNLSYRARFNREIMYVASATALHIENATRRETNQRETPPHDMKRILSYSRQQLGGQRVTNVRRPSVRIITEPPGWIMHRKAAEIQKHMGTQNVRINEEFPETDIHYYINYGKFHSRPKAGVVVANFTHYDPDLLADKFRQVAVEADHCVAVSKLTAERLLDLGIPESRISVILVGADISFRPKLTVGVVGRVYPGGRKGEDIVARLLADSDITEKVRIVASSDQWAAPVWSFDDPADFYRAIDYLLVPSRLEGGPVPFMEALACGTMAIAPEIGVVPQFPHISYPAGDFAALKQKLLELADLHFMQREFLTAHMQGINWTGWACAHEALFRSLLWQRRESISPNGSNVTQTSRHFSETSSSMVSQDSL